MSLAHIAPRERLLAVLGIERYSVHSASADAAGSQQDKRLVLACGRDAATALGGRYAPLLRHLLASMGVAAEATLIAARPGADLPTVCFGTEAGARIDAVLAPPLAALRQSPVAKRALWRGLRGIKRSLASG